MRYAFITVAIIVLAAGCVTKTTVVKPESADEASQILKQGEAASSDNHLDQGKRLYFLGKYDQATKHFIRSIANNRESWEAYYYLGLTQQKREQYDRSIGSFNNSLTYAPADRELRARINFALGVSWENEGYLLKAQERYQKALNLSPGYTQAKVAVDRVTARHLKAELEKKNTKKGDKAF